MTTMTSINGLVEEEDVVTSEAVTTSEDENERNQDDTQLGIESTRV